MDAKSGQNIYWREVQAGQAGGCDILRLVLLGFLIGVAAGTVVSIFRITANEAYALVALWAGKHRADWWAWLLWLIIAACAALATGQLMKNPAIRSGGAGWIRQALASGQPKVWQVILAPKFIGSWLVKACGVSVGMEGPSIQMGCAAAMGLQNLSGKKTERRYFMLGGCAAGLAAAFSAPFAGICYVYEVMAEQMSKNLFLFLLAGSFGVYFTCSALFGLGTLLPFEGAPMPPIGKYWLLALLACFSAAAGIAYNYLLRLSLSLFGDQKLVSPRFSPLLAFLATGLLLFIFPATTGEGMDVFPAMDAGRFSLLFLCALLLIKLLFTAYCYGTEIPAGQMVPILCIGGISGAIFSLFCQNLGVLGAEYFHSCITIGMAGAFSASERAPVTGLVLVAQMTGAWSVGAGILFASAIAAFLARLARVRPI